MGHSAITRQIRIAVVCLGLIAASVGFAGQKGTSIVSRIKFQRGRTTAVVTGTVRRGMSRDYLLRAGAGQLMSVHLAAPRGVSFLMTGPRRELLAEYTNDWSGELPSSGDYRINVLPNTSHDRISRFTLEVTVR